MLPEPPMTRTRCPGRTRACLRRKYRAVVNPSTVAAACGKRGPAERGPRRPLGQAQVLGVRSDGETGEPEDWSPSGNRVPRPDRHRLARELQPEPRMPLVAGGSRG